MGVCLKEKNRPFTFMILNWSPQRQVYYTIYIIIYSENNDRKKN